jgi:hypothetical protein
MSWEHPPAVEGWTRFMKEILVFVFLCASAVEDFAITKEKICKQRKETCRILVHNSDTLKPISHPTCSLYSGVPRSLNLNSSLTLSSGYSTIFEPWKTGITATTFWVGEPPTPNDPGNLASAWDPNWIVTSKTQNPFYVALPYNDVAGGHTKPEARSIIPWFKQAFVRDGQSVLKDRWIAIRKGARVCYAQWEDVGPFQVDHWQYVFGDEMPRPNVNHNAGIDLSPAVRDYLEMSGMDQCDWKFVEADEIPQGPWKYGDSGVSSAAERPPVCVADAQRIERCWTAQATGRCAPNLGSPKRKRKEIRLRPKLDWEEDRIARSE